MSPVRRNTIDTRDARLVALASAISALVAAFAGVEPTGEPVVDVALTCALAALTTWLGASAPWWALTVASLFALGGSLSGPLLLVALAATATGAAVWIGFAEANQPALRAGITAAAVQVLLRLSWDPWFLAPTAVAAMAIGLILFTGYRRRRGYVRKRVFWGAVGVSVATVAAIGMLAVAGYKAAPDANDGYDALLDALDEMDDGDVDAASQTLWQASYELRSASDELSAPLAQPARLVPGIAQNRAAGAEAVDRAATASAAAAAALAAIDLDDLTIVGGQVDVDALAGLAEPLAELDDAVTDLRDSLRAAGASPWLVAPFQARLDDAIERADDTARQADTLALAAAVGPSMLGDDQPRHYLMAFVNTAESRSQSGLMGNWVEITIDDGRLSITAAGRTADLQTAALDDLELDASDEYLARYGPFGAVTPTGGVDRKYWSNVTMSPDMPSVGSAMAQMYERVTGRDVDGVFVIDARGLAHLLDITGSIRLGDRDLRLGAETLEPFLLRDQYLIEEAEREVVLDTIIALTMQNVLSGALPTPQELIPALAPGALNGHISAWATRPEEQQLFEQVGMDASLPVPLQAGIDSLAVTSNNAAGNKIDSFLERTIEYLPRVDQRTGEITATLTVTLVNGAPTSGFPDYVIGSIVGLPLGTNRSIVDVFTTLEVDGATLDGEPFDPTRGAELSHNVYTRRIDIPSGETAVLEYELSGTLGAGRYELVYRPQPLPNPDRLSVEATGADGDLLFTFDGELERRSVISADGVEAWR